MERLQSLSALRVIAKDFYTHMYTYSTPVAHRISQRPVVPKDRIVTGDRR
jgi:hypothetical protein